MAIYAPLSPRAGYTPQSPRSGYVPQSPRSSFSVQGDGRLQGILDSMKNQKSATLKEAPFAPVMNHQAYLRSMEESDKRHAKILPPKIRERYLEESEVRLAKIKSKHEQWYAAHPPLPPKPQKEPINVSKDMDYVIVDLKVLKSGKIKAYVGAPMAEIHEQYLSKGVRPPLIEHLKALKRFRYPDWVLENVVKNHEKLPEKKKKMEEMIETVFGKYSNSKPSKPKKKTVTEQLTSKMREIQRANKRN